MAKLSKIAPPDPTISRKTLGFLANPPGRKNSSEFPSASPAGSLYRLETRPRARSDPEGPWRNLKKPEKS
jgi:hypothetical protein